MGQQQALREGRPKPIPTGRRRRKRVSGRLAAARHHDLGDGHGAHRRRGLSLRRPRTPDSDRHRFRRRGHVLACCAPAGGVGRSPHRLGRPPGRRHGSARGARRRADRFPGLRSFGAASADRREASVVQLDSRFRAQGRALARHEPRRGRARRARPWPRLGADRDRLPLGADFGLPVLSGRPAPVHFLVAGPEEGDGDDVREPRTRV